MRDREANYHRQKHFYRFYSVIMLLCTVGFLVGFITLAISRQLGIDVISYSLVIAIVVSPFFFIARTRYERAKLAYAALQYAKGKLGHAPR